MAREVKTRIIEAVTISVETAFISGVTDRLMSPTTYTGSVVAPGPWDYSWAYVGSFNWDTDYECQAYTGDNSWIWIADSASHAASSRSSAVK